MPTLLRRRCPVVVAALTAAVALGACAPDDEAKPADCTVVDDGEVRLDGRVSGWDPGCLEVAVGTTLTFSARLLDDEPHNLEVSGPSLSTPARTGDPVKGGPLELDVSMDEVGFHQYVCTIHPAMEGDLYVEDG